MAKRYAVLAAAGWLLAFASTVSAQDYPNRPVRIIVPFPPGAINDTVGRQLAAQLTERFGKQFIVENKPGAGGVVGTEIAANAPKDGYTLLIVSTPYTLAPSLYKLPYNPHTAFAPVAIVLSAPNVIVVHPSVAKSLKELVDLAKQKPGEIQYGSGGVGSFMHLGGELFKLSAGVDLLHVPYKGGGPAITSLIGGHVGVVFATTVTGPPHVRAGKARARGRIEEPPSGVAGCPHRRGSRGAGLRGRQLGRRGGARRHAAGDPRQAP
jgi:tripartite-type tricarboxylate transporter receptor subunit TctC